MEFQLLLVLLLPSVMRQRQPGITEKTSLTNQISLSECVIPIQPIQGQCEISNYCNRR